MYSVRFVGENDLPPAQAWVMAQGQDGSCYLFIKRSAVYPVILEETWAAFVRLEQRLQQSVA